MQPTWILYSLLGMFLLSLSVGLRMLQLRYRAVLKDNVRPSYFKLNRGAKLPDYLAQATQHYDNLYETPVLFYVIVILAYILGVVDWVTLSLAYGYLISRIFHALIHMNSNHLLRRRNIFLVTIVILTFMWLYVFTRLIFAA